MSAFWARVAPCAWHGVEDISSFCLSHASCAHMLAYVCWKFAHVCAQVFISPCTHGAPARVGAGVHTWHPCSRSAVPAHRSAPAHTQHTRGHTRGTALPRACACVHPRLLPAAVHPCISGVFARQCVLVYTRMLPGTRRGCPRPRPSGCTGSAPPSPPLPW